jgi:DNA-binding CsgD family transcriptional regulator
MSRADSLELGRESFRRQAWGDAYRRLSAAAGEAPLDAEDVERLAASAQLLGRNAESLDLLTRAHQGFLAAANPQRAARAAFWIGFALMNRGEAARAGGWLARAERLLDDAGLDCAERGYLLLATARRCLSDGDVAGAYDAFAAAAAIGLRFADRDLVAMARHGMGRAVLEQGDLRRGAALLDEAMVAVLAGEVSPILAGIIYCSVLDACHQVYDLGRAREWTTALTAWCAAQPDMVPFRGHCQIRRAELLQLKGDWSDALSEARRVRAQPGEPASWSPVRAALYRIAELHRLRGEFAEAEAAYTQTSEQGRSPHPGLALLRLAQGQTEAATAAIRRATAEARNDRDRSQLLSASVEILLAAGDVAGARGGADELAAIAERLEAPFLRALAAQAAGAVLLAEEQPRAALAELRRAAALWQELDAPYEGARVAVLVARACRALGDAEGGAMELTAARRAFERLGAASDLARLDSQSAAPEPGTTGTLTAREVQVLRLVASGRTNRAIAAELRISEKTVARHVSNIFTKLGLSSRAAATAWAYESGLAGTSA